MKCILIYKNILIIMLVANVAFGEVDRVHIVRKLDRETEAEYKVPLKNGEFLNREVWRSKNGIACSVSIFPKGSQYFGTYQCVTPEKYQAQIEFDCQKQNSSNNSIYLFFGNVGSYEETGNFYIWCEINA
mgnify:FL=1